MGKGGFRTTAKMAEVKKTFGKEALELCGFLHFQLVSAVKLEEKIELSSDKGKEKEMEEDVFEVRDEEKVWEEKMETMEREEKERRLMEIELEGYLKDMEWSDMIDQEFPLSLEDECIEWDWKIFGKKWERKGPALRERRPSRSLKKEKINPKRYKRSRDQNSSPKFTFQPRSIENYVPSRRPAALSKPVIPEPATSRPSRRPHFAPRPALGRWEEIPEAILPRQKNPPARVRVNHQANRSNLDGDLQKALETSVVAAPSGKRYTPEQAARMLIEMQNREITPDDFALLSILDECLQKKTVEEEALEKLPVSLWKDLKVAGCSSPSSSSSSSPSSSPSSSSSSSFSSSSDCSVDDSCRICLLEYEEDDELCTLPCSHLFHKDCIKEWLSSNSTACPLDGQEVKV